MVNKKYIVKKGDSGLYTSYRKNEAGYAYQMAVTHKDIAEQVCHLFKCTFDSLSHSSKDIAEQVCHLLNRLEHPEDE